MSEFIRNELAVTQFVKTQNLDFSSLALNVNGRQIIYLDALGSNLVIDITSITNLEGGQFELSIIGSDTYNVSFSAAFQSLIANTSLLLPVFTNGAGNRNNLIIVWNDPMGASSTAIDERLIGLSNIVNKTYTAPANPTVVSFTVENTDPDNLVMALSSACTGDETGFSIASDGDPISINGYTSGSGSSTFNFALSRDVVFGETLTVTIDGTNTIESVAGSLALDISGSPYSVVNNVVGDSYETIYDKSFSDNTLGLYFSAGSVTVANQKCTIVGNGGVDWIFLNWKTSGGQFPNVAAGDVVRITIYDVVRSNDLCRIMLNAGANNTDGVLVQIDADGTFQTSNLTVPNDPDNLYMIIGEISTTFNIEFTRVLIERLL